MFYRCFGKRCVASQDEKLVVQHKDGRVEHIRGPRQLFFTRFTHESVRVVPLPRFVASCEEALRIVFVTGEIERRIGPASQIQDPELHQSIEVVRLQRYLADLHQYLLVQFRDGRKEVVRGPSEIVFDPVVHHDIKLHNVQRRRADDGKYLSVQYHDGRVEHIVGPVELVLEPFVHAAIEVHDAVKLAANEAIVVYRRTDGSSVESSVLEQGKAIGGGGMAKSPGDAAIVVTSGASPTVVTAAVPLEGEQQGAVEVERRVVRGPAVFMPESSEWLHKFSWHGSTKNGKGSLTGSPGDRKHPHALNFTVLRCMADQIYYSVRDVRTLDDAKLDVHLMIFFELRAIEQMLDSTNDLIGDILSAASADVMTFAAGRTYEQFLQETSALSQAGTTFPILGSRMEQTGTALLKVVYRGYSTSQQLQNMHDDAIARRTKLRLESDAAREEQANVSMELNCRQERSEREQKLEEERARHELALKALALEQERAQAATEHAEALRQQRESAKALLEQERAKHEEELHQARELAAIEVNRLRKVNAAELEKQGGLKELGVDLTKYLCALATLKPDSHLRIDTTDGTQSSPNIHIMAASAAASR